MSNRYKVQFEFTTMHRGSKFVGRDGQLFMETTDDLKTVKENLTQVRWLCLEFINQEKPKWNVLLLNVTDISQAQTVTK